MNAARTRLRRTAVLATALVSMGAALAACGGGGDGADGQIKVGIAQGVPADLYTVIADQQGFFEKRGVDVELQKPSISNTQAAALISGDLGEAQVISALLWPAIDKGACVKALGGSVGNTMEIIGQPGTAVDPNDLTASLQAMKGKTMGVIARGSGTELWTVQLLQEAGLDRNDVDFIAVGAPATAVEAFKAKRVDYLYFGPTMAPQLSPSDYVEVTHTIGKTDNALSPLVSGFYSMSCDTVKNRPDDVTNFCKALWDAYDFTQDDANAGATGKALADLTLVDESQGSALWTALKPAYLPPSVSEEQWKAQEPLAGSPAPDAPNYGDSVYEPCASGDPR